MAIISIAQHRGSNLAICGSVTTHELRQAIHSLRASGLHTHAMPSSTIHADVRVSYAGATGKTLVEYWDGAKHHVCLKASDEGRLEINDDVLSAMVPARSTVGSSAYLVKLLRQLQFEQNGFPVHLYSDLLNPAARKTVKDFYAIARKVVDTSKSDVVLYPREGSGPLASSPSAPLIFRHEGDNVGIYNSTTRQLVMRVAMHQLSFGPDYHQGDMNVAIHSLVSAIRPMLLTYLAELEKRGKDIHNFFRDLESHIHWVTQKEIAIFGDQILREPGSTETDPLKFILADSFTYIHESFRLERSEGHWKITFRSVNPNPTAQLAIYYDTAKDKMRLYAPTYDYLRGRNWEIPEVLNMRASIFNGFSSELNAIALDRVSANAAIFNITPEEFKTVTRGFAVYLKQAGEKKLNLPEYIELVRPFIKELPHA